MARAMKDSGIQWIGKVPANWECVPIRSLFQEVSRKNLQGLVTKALKFTYGEIVAKTGFESEEDNYVANTIQNYTIVDPGTIILNGLNLNFDFVTRRIGLVKERGVITSAYMAFKPIDSQEITPEYAAYLLKSYDYCKAFHNMGGGVRKILNFSELKHQYVLCPRLDIQQSIVAFLDDKCAEIDALMADVQAQIETLEQYKRSVITEAVTKGLNPNVPLQNSSTDWIGQVPIHWSISKIKYEMIPIERSVYETDGIITCFRNGEVTLRSNRREEGFTISLTEHGYHGVDVGDLVIHGMDAFAGAIGCSDSRGKITPVVHVCRTTGNQRFFMYFLRSMAYGDILMDLSDGVRIRSSDYRNFSKLGKLSICVPPHDEQDKIVDYLDSKVKQIDDVITQKQEQLDILEEYKKSIIFEYVTGKKEVPIS